MSQQDSSRRLAALVNAFEGAEFIAATMHGTRWERTMAAGRYAAAALALHSALQDVDVPTAKRGFHGADSNKIGHMALHFGGMTRAMVIRRMITVQRLMEKHQIALEQNDYKCMESAFDAYIKMERRDCARLADVLPDIKEPFDVMLDRHVPGLRYAHIEAIEKAIMPSCLNALYAQKPIEPTLQFVMGQEKQKKLGNLLMDRMGFDRKRATVLWDAGKPFIRGYGDHVSLVVRARGADFTWMVTDLAHEAAGHGVYRQVVPRAKDWKDTCAAMVPHAMADEIPALMLEHFVCKTKGFAAFLHKAMTDSGVNHNELTADEIYTRMQVNARNRTRVESDLKSYPLHALHRIRVVRDLVNGTKEAADYPRLWRWHEADYALPYAKSERDGMLADMQMFTGYAGYFGSYVPALMAAAEEFERMGRDVPDWEAKLAQGDFGPVQQWLKVNIHERGGTYKPGSDPAAFVRYMDAKFPPRPQVQRYTVPKNPAP